MEGVERVVVGYTGGQDVDPTYQNIKDSTEAVLIEFDPAVISYEDILNEWVKQHHPFMMQKRQYRSAIWVKNDKERGIATKIVEDLFASSGLKVYTEVEDINPFYRAEEYHQDFLNKQSTGAGAWIR